MSYLGCNVHWGLHVICSRHSVIEFHSNFGQHPDIISPYTFRPDQVIRLEVENAYRSLFFWPAMYLHQVVFDVCEK